MAIVIKYHKMTNGFEVSNDSIRDSTNEIILNA